MANTYTIGSNSNPHPMDSNGIDLGSKLIVFNFDCKVYCGIW